MRVIVTGSRDWDDAENIYHDLANLPDGSTIVHGAARGADAIAHRAAGGLGHTPEPHPADWDRYGKAAGAIRNQEMVDAGADGYLAYPLPQSRGTIDCIERCELAKIPSLNGHHR